MPLLSPGTIVGDWRIDSQLGVGGMGVVYAATHRDIGKQAAIKVIHADDPVAIERFLQEAWVVNQIGHPNIVDIFQLGRLDDGRPYLVMELVRGRTLGERMDEGRVAALDAIELLLQMCRALAAAHSHGVLHRDLKPDNVLIGEGGRVKLADWGIAKVKAGPSVTDAGTMLGTPRYASPEQARGKDIDERTDIYSLGAIAYELFTESPPFTCDNVGDLLAAHLCEPVAPPSEVWPDIPADLETLLLAMLAKRADDRPSLVDVAVRLERARDELLARSGLVAPPAPRRTISPPAAPRVFAEVALAETIPPSPPRTPWLAIGAAVCCAFGVAAVFARAFAGSGERMVSALHVSHAAPRPERVPLDVRYTPTDAHAAVDGVALDAGPGRAQIALPPGTHTIDVTAPGFTPYRKVVEVVPGGVTVAIDLDPVAAQPRVRARVPHLRHVDPDAVIDPFR